MSTDMVPKKDRLDWWTHLCAHEFGPVALSTEHIDDFCGMASSVDLGGLRVAEFAVSPMTGRRTPAHIRQHDPDGYRLFLVHGNPVRLEQRRNDSYLETGDIALFDTSYPFATDFLNVGRSTRFTFLFLPREALPLPRDDMERLLASKLSARTGSGAMLARYLTALREHATGCDPAELPRLGTIGVDLAAVFLAGRLGTEGRLPVESRQRALVARIDAFIDHHLGDPELGPVGIAAHHHVSVRTLHVLFERQPETVSATIRRRRLERCRADLADPLLRERPIGEIGLRWGFRNAAEFSRAFRAAYGMSPREHRQQALGQDGEERSTRSRDA
ncbi:helix-turn-helix domain-containing protein [Nonomuraea zeae]|uniref:AraC-like ligand-binding domain-containing protein n=1 Tax=Nonomuraea zeae TaxID=1642303 RepID=UPI00110A2C1E|nr:helix-turn-helix domain-containing protein [Nonomuraea zeae]